MNYRIWEIQYAGSPKTLWSQVEPTPTQLEIAARLGIQASPGDTFAVVASTILEKVGDAIGCPPRHVSDRQEELGEELGLDVGVCKSSWVAFVKIKEAIQLANLDAARRMELKPGDRAVNSFNNTERYLQGLRGDKGEPLSEQIQREDEVSSIRKDGQVFFKGGGQAPARYLERSPLSD